MGIETVRLRLVFSEQLIKKPIIFEVTTLFEVVPNILKADIQAEGWVTLDLSGTPEEIEKALNWLYGQGVRIEFLFADEVD